MLPIDGFAGHVPLPKLRRGAQRPVVGVQGCRVVVQREEAPLLVDLATSVPAFVVGAFVSLVGAG